MTGNSEQGGEMLRRVRALADHIEDELATAHPKHRQQLTEQWADHWHALAIEFTKRGNDLFDRAKGEAA